MINIAHVAADNPSAADVLMAMSGGVDSTVAASLLVQEGYNVVGATMKLFDNDLIGEGSESSCCSLDDVQDAKDACRRLGIQHFTFNFKDRFEQDVVQRFCDSYVAGLTPNPCIDCNRYLKFAALQKRRQELGADYVATGHYARRNYDEKTGAWKLLRAADHSKDQSYVLYHLTQDDLAHMLFPLGDLTKTEVRALAQEQGFGNAEKGESQDICFVPDGRYTDFISRYKGGEVEGVAFQQGEIVDRDGKVLGTHNGLIGYTIGQRKGIGIASASPLYVIRKDIAQNRLIVGHRNELLTDEVLLEDVNVISGDPAGLPSSVSLKTSYRQKPVPGEIEMLDEGSAKVRFDEPVVRPAPGQSVVVYLDDEVLCGGIVANPSA